MKPIRSVLCLAILVIFASCLNATQLKEWTNFQQAVQKKYHCEQAGVQLQNNTLLIVNLINSPYNDSSNAVKQVITNEIGTLGKQYLVTTKYKHGIVSFVNSQNHLLLHTNRSQSFSMQ